MKAVKLGLMILLCLFNVEFNNSTLANSSGENGKTAYFDEEQNIFELVNSEREKRGLDSLEWNSKLADLARAYSQKMARERFFDHFDNQGNSVAERAKARRITKWRQIGENLFMCDGNQKFSQLAVKGWMKSRGHRQNILEENYNQTGIGVARSRDGMIYVTQVFMQY